jgi:hypothetical protein
MNRPLRIAVAAAAVVAVTVVGANLADRWSSAADRSPTPTPSHLPFEPGLIDSARTIELRGPSTAAPAVGWPSFVTAFVPGGWTQQSLARGGALTIDDATLTVGSVGNLLAEPCTAGAERGPERTPPMGSTVDDLVEAIRSIPGLETTDPVAVTLAGFVGKRIDLTHPATSACSRLTLWLTPPSRGESWAVDSIEGWHHWLWILDVDGLRFVVLASFSPTASDRREAELQQIVESIQIAR